MFKKGLKLGVSRYSVFSDYCLYWQFSECCQKPLLLMKRKLSKNPRGCRLSLLKKPIPPAVLKCLPPPTKSDDTAGKKTP